MVTLYIQLYKNRMVVRNLATQQQASGNQPFSNQRIIVADFFLAEKLLQDLILQVAPRSFWHALPGAGKLAILAHALEMNEGGLSAVEERAIMEMTFGAAHGRCRAPYVIATPTPLSDPQVLDALQHAKKPNPANNKKPTIIS
ncbi:YjaA family stress response protein [Kosakonia cowanii]|uniref:YjaA family stress response protein n=1 Tax=Kosakonia cowanii TaxID=208223 RepID=UPI0023FA3719|nr:YjaA family stress response protein [Kosakonia cowanii]MDF7761671.1 YjaA family stress response protein [Kosakonia cowanii]